MRIRQAIALAALLLSFAACHWTPVIMNRQMASAAPNGPQAAPVPSQLHTLIPRAR